MADRRLQVFHTVGRMLSFTKAAEVLQMTQPAVTFQVRQLEEQYNVRLFDRSHNRIDLTEAGKRAYQYAERIFSLYGEMENSIREVTGNVSGLLRIGASTASAQYVLPTLLSEFQEKFPDVHIQLKVSPTAGVISLIENSFVDIGVVETVADAKKLIVKPFYEQELVVCVPSTHELASRNSVHISQLIDQPWITREEGSSSREAIFEYLTQLDMKTAYLKPVMELGCPEAIKAAVEAGRGISILPRDAIEKEIRLGTLKALSLEPKLIRSVSFVYKEQKFQLRAVDELLSFANKANAYSAKTDECEAQATG